MKTYGEWTDWLEIISPATKIKHRLRGRSVFIDGNFDSIEYETQFPDCKNPLIGKENKFKGVLFFIDNKGHAYGPVDCEMPESDAEKHSIHNLKAKLTERNIEFISEGLKKKK